MKNLTYEAIDWNNLRQEAQKRKSTKKKTAQEWNNRAPSFAKRTTKSIYTRNFIELLNPQKNWSLLDVGSGPGTLAIPLAPKVKKITCLDYSENMLAILKQKTRKGKINNIVCCNGSWEDDWPSLGITPHDVAIASRSLAVDNLQQALEKLCMFAKKKVAVTDRVKHGPRDPYAFKAVGRELEIGPDYIYTLNLLYQMGIQASCTFIKLQEKQEYPDLEEAVQSYSWMFHNLNEKEKKKLKNYVQSITTRADNDMLQLNREHLPTWAFISWHPQERSL